VAATTDQEVMDLAEKLGIATSYVDGDQVEHPSSIRALRGIIELLRAGTGGDGGQRSHPFDFVVLIRGGRWYRGVAPRFDQPIVVTVELEDGSTIGPRRVAERLHLDRAVPAPTLPIGIHRLRWSAATSGAEEREATLLVAPRHFPGSTPDRPGLGLFTPAYALWSESEPLPSYHGLAALGEATADLGVDTIVTLPLYAQGFGDRFASSPYSPLSRFHWNELLVPDHLLGHDGGPAPAHQATTTGTRVDWEAVTVRRAAQLDGVAARLDPSERAQLAAFLDARPDVSHFARYAAGDDELLIRRHEVGQWLAELSMAEVVARFEATGQRLALDLPVGARTESWDVVRWPELFVAEASIGAPPDYFFAGGQCWNLPPVHPIASRVDGHRMWHDLLATACRFAGVLRIDHVMQVHRLWWVPDGHDAADGAYVHYPADELLAVAAIVAHRTGTVMVGEDLGTVPPVVGDLLDDWGLIGMHMERFTMYEWATPEPAAKPSAPPRRLPAVPPDSWASIRTHDMPALAAEMVEADFDPYREALAVELGRSVAYEPESLTTGVLARLRASRAYEIVIDLDDVLGVEAPHNQPGTDGDANWTRRLALSTDDLADEPRLRRVLASDREPPTAGT
jgi:4-alpha-glucanotransferase